MPPNAISSIAIAQAHCVSQRIHSHRSIPQSQDAAGRSIRPTTSLIIDIISSIDRPDRSNGGVGTIVVPSASATAAAAARLLDRIAASTMGARRRRRSGPSSRGSSRSSSTTEAVAQATANAAAAPRPAGAGRVFQCLHPASPPVPAARMCPAPVLGDHCRLLLRRFIIIIHRAR